ncbi:MAG: glycosyltransferase family 2 protein [Deltaproteobacteria bacterium]|nr:glycosyltransferase family 2 protein [Deltaproteobacteria bacterium]
MDKSLIDDKLPLISIIIPVHNRKAYIQTAVKSALDQTYPNIEVVVIDDASDDDTYEALEALRLPIVLLRNKLNSGPAASRNAGIRACRGEYLFFLDSDDAMESDAIETLWQALHTKELQDKTWGVAYGKRLTCDSGLNPVKTKPKKYHTGWILAYLLQDNIVRTGTYLVKKSIVLEVGGFLENLFDHDDLLLCYLIAARHKFVFMDQYISRFRRHAGVRVRNNYQKVLNQGIAHLDYFFKETGDLEPGVLKIKNKIYAIEHLKMAKMAWRASLPEEYLSHWKKILSYNKFYLLHPKYAVRALISALK